jgi:hypothetical protein
MHICENDPLDFTSCGPGDVVVIATADIARRGMAKSV